ncbi:MAG: FGGY-family carbohydrate kinase [Bacillus subtilis]|nr:FGGY-family carbohydrate kinase [Bacillus subtilis]
MQKARSSASPAARSANTSFARRLEAIAYQTKDVLNAMQDESKIKLARLRVDGGASNNDFLMQFQSDILNVYIDKPITSETTALGACYLAGLAIGFFTLRGNRRHVGRRQSI